MKNKTTVWSTTIIVLLLVMMSAYAFYAYDRPITIDYWEHLDETALVVERQTYSLRELVFYVAYEEYSVERQAEIYDAKNTNAFWNLHTNGEFIKVSARDAAMEMAVHDIIFYQLAKKNGLELSADEQEILELRQYDFWSDLTDTQKQRLEKLKPELEAGLAHKALAEKQQELSAALSGDSVEAYATDGIKYKQMLQGYSYKVTDDIWNKLNFGNITLSHE